MASESLESLQGTVNQLRTQLAAARQCVAERDEEIKQWHAENARLQKCIQWRDKDTDADVSTIDRLKAEVRRLNPPGSPAIRLSVTFSPDGSISIQRQ